MFDVKGATWRRPSEAIRAHEASEDTLRELVQWRESKGGNRREDWLLVSSWRGHRRSVVRLHPRPDGNASRRILLLDRRAPEPEAGHRILYGSVVDRSHVSGARAHWGVRDDAADSPRR